MLDGAEFAAVAGDVGAWRGVVALRVVPVRDVPRGRGVCVKEDDGDGGAA